MEIEVVISDKFGDDVTSFDYAAHFEGNSIDDLLQKEGTTLDELLNLGDFVEALNSRNENLLNL